MQIKYDYFIAAMCLVPVLNQNDWKLLLTLKDKYMTNFHNSEISKIYIVHGPKGVHVGFQSNTHKTSSIL